MKKLKNIVNKAVLIGFGMVAVLAHSQAGEMNPNLVGSFRGKYQSDGKPRIDLVMRSLTAAGRDGSYLGVLLQNSPLKIAVYLIDPTEDGKYVMQPRQVTADGEVVGTDNVDPSLVLNVTGYKNGLGGVIPTFNITNANASNRNGFQGSMIFNNDEPSDLEWLDVTKGNFSVHGDKVMIPDNLTDHETGISLTLPGRLSGEYTLREKMTGVYTLTVVQVTAEGDVRAKNPSNIVLFLKKPSLFGSDFFTLINPYDYQDVVKLVRRPWGQ